MKYKWLIISTTAFFLIVNTTYFWEGKLGGLAFPVFTVLFILYVILFAISLRQLILSFKEKFSDRQRVIVSVGLILLLLLTAFKPSGIIDFDKLSGKDLLIAEREGAANCTTILKLKDNNTFIEKSVCFGITEVKGSYEIKGDTIFFKKVSLGRDAGIFYQYAVVRPASFQNKKIIGALMRYKDKAELKGHELWIIKNELKDVQ
jgi:hypothetical protein